MPWHRSPEYPDYEISDTGQVRERRGLRRILKPWEWCGERGVTIEHNRRPIGVVILHEGERFVLRRCEEWAVSWRRDAERLSEQPR